LFRLRVAGSASRGRLVVEGTGQRFPEEFAAPPQSQPAVRARWELRKKLRIGPAGPFGRACRSSHSRRLRCLAAVPKWTASDGGRTTRWWPAVPAKSDTERDRLNCSPDATSTDRPPTAARRSACEWSSTSDGRRNCPAQCRATSELRTGHR